MNNKVYFIAEAGVNHNGSLTLALKLVEEAKKAGADAVKFQTFKASNLVTATAQKAQYQKRNTGSDESQFEMLQKLELSFDEFKIIKKHCDSVGILFLSTPFDEECADFLVKELQMPLIKVSSGDSNNFPFIDFLLKYNKPLIVSTGMCTQEEVDQVVHYIRSKNGEFNLLHCTSNYPCDPSEVNLKVLLTFQNRYKNLTIGYSDHTMGHEISLAAVALGARIIEKHFTLDTKLEGPDHVCSLNTESLCRLITSIRLIEKAIGDGVKSPTTAEMNTLLVVRKSLVIKNNLQKGSILRFEDLLIKRPGTGIPPNEFYHVIGQKLNRDKLSNEILTWDDLA